jgi:hypothetical protein
VDFRDGCILRLFVSETAAWRLMVKNLISMRAPAYTRSPGTATRRPSLYFAGAAASKGGLAAQFDSRPSVGGTGWREMQSGLTEKPSAPGEPMNNSGWLPVTVPTVV